MFIAKFHKIMLKSIRYSTVLEYVFLFLFAMVLIPAGFRLFSVEVLDAMSVLLILCGMGVAAYKKRIWLSPWLLLYLAVSLVVDLINTGFMIHWNTWAKWILVLAVSSLVSELGRGKENALLRLILTVTLLMFLLSIWQVYTGNYFVYYSGWEQETILSRAISASFVHPNVLSLVSGLCFLVLLSSILSRNFDKVTLLFLLMAIFCLVMSKGRMVIVGVFVGSLVQLFLYSKYTRYVSLALAILALIFSPVVFFLSRDVGTGLASLLWRIDLWLHVLTEVPLSVLLFGGGAYFVEDFLGNSTTFFYVEQIHNDYLSVLLESGVLGLFFYVVTLISCFVAALSLPRGNYLRLAVPSIFSLIMVSSITENLLVVTVFQVYTWALYAMVRAR